MDRPPETARRALLERACGLTTDADVREHTICIDPGYPRYVQRLLVVRRSHGKAGIEDTDWEPIFHAARDSSETESFDRYRLFTATIGLLHPSCPELLAANPLALVFVDFAAARPDWAPAIYSALDELHRSLSFSSEDETPFAALACLLVASTAQLDVDLDALTERVFDEATIRTDETLLWSCTNHTDAFPRWKARVERMPTSSESLRSLRNALLGS